MVLLWMVMGIDWIMIDRGGVAFDGDRLLYIIARHRQKQNRLLGGVVGTPHDHPGLNMP